MKFRSIALTVLLIGIVSFSVRAIYVMAITSDDAYTHLSFPADGLEYMHLAENIVHYNRYAESTGESRYIAILRPPGYPIFYSFFEYFELTPTGVFWAQALISSFIPVFTALITILFLNSLKAGFFAGILSVFSGPGIVFVGEIMADLLLAAVFITGFLILLYGVFNKHNLSIISASLVFSVGVLIKPVLLLWPIFSLLILYLLGSARHIRIKPVVLGIFCLIQVSVISAWCFRNYSTEDMFTFSTISVRTLRQYLAVQVESAREVAPMIRLIRSKDFAAHVGNKKHHLARQFQQDLASGVSVKELTKDQLSQSLRIIKADPYYTWQFYTQNVLHNVIGELYLPVAFYESQPQLSNISKYLLVSTYTSSMVTRICFAIAALFIAVSPWLNRKYPEQILKSQVYFVYALVLIFLYFALLSGITFWTGPRIVFPADFALITSFVIILNYIFSVYAINNSNRTSPLTR